MKSSRMHRLIRRSHRWLGVIIGIQFIAWTIGGSYFSWSDMDEVHGDYEHIETPLLDSKASLASPSLLLNSLHKTESVDSLVDVQLVSILSKMHWLITYYPKGHERHFKKYVLGDATTGIKRPALSEEEAIKVARQSYIGKDKMSGVEHIITTDGHHEYRGQPLPAYAVTFGVNSPVTFYIPADIGVVQKVRNTVWRRFDFLWMLHTMDYSSRDNITNWLLRIFSAFGLVTVLSGFTLFYFSQKKRSG
jgi:hypothetical protein